MIGDVTDKGVPGGDGDGGDAERAARVGAADRLAGGRARAASTSLMCPDMPPKMFVTCLYGVLDPATGRFRFANAGHNLPYVRTDSGTIELRATGMPLGLMPGIVYEETRGGARAGPDDAAAFRRRRRGAQRRRRDVRLPAADGRRRRPQRERRRDRPRARPSSTASRPRAGSRRTTSRSWRCSASAGPPRPSGRADVDVSLLDPERARERAAGDASASSRRSRRSSSRRPARKLKTAVAEATMNAIEHGNESTPDLPVRDRRAARQRAC